MSTQIGFRTVSSAEIEAERYFGKIILLLNEEKAIELPLLAQLLYLPYAKLYYWLVKRRLWNDCIRVEKRDEKLWVFLGGPVKCWLAAVYKIDTIEGPGEKELWGRMVEIANRGNVALFAYKLDDGRILLLRPDIAVKI